MAVELPKQKKFAMILEKIVWFYKIKKYKQFYVHKIIIMMIKT